MYTENKNENVEKCRKADARKNEAINLVTFNTEINNSLSLSLSLSLSVVGGTRLLITLPSFQEMNLKVTGD